MRSIPIIRESLSSRLKSCSNKTDDGAFFTSLFWTYINQKGLPILIITTERLSELSAFTVPYAVVHKGKSHHKSIPASCLRCSQSISLSMFFPDSIPTEGNLSAYRRYCIRMLCFYLEKTRPLIKSNILFVSCAEWCQAETFSLD